MSKTITNDDLAMLKYFWQEKGNVHRWVDFNRKWPALLQEYPLIAKAITDYDMAERVLTLVLKDIETED